MHLKSHPASKRKVFGEASDSRSHRRNIWTWEEAQFTQRRAGEGTHSDKEEPQFILGEGKTGLHGAAVENHKPTQIHRQTRDTEVHQALTDKLR